jgi:hypothetical protein
MLLDGFQKDLAVEDSGLEGLQFIFSDCCVGYSIVQPNCFHQNGLCVSDIADSGECCGGGRMSTRFQERINIRASVWTLRSVPSVLGSKISRGIVISDMASPTRSMVGTRET